MIFVLLFICSIPLLILKLYLSYETLDQIKIQMESLEVQNYHTPSLTFYEDFSIEYIEGNYGARLTAVHKDPIGGSIMIVVNCVGEVKISIY
jgi:hypothetical protein